MNKINKYGTSVCFGGKFDYNCGLTCMSQIIKNKSDIKKLHFMIEERYISYSFGHF